MIYFRGSAFVLISILLFSYQTNCFATDQEEESTGYITGVVYDGNMNPLIRATVIVMGTSYGAMTDSTGNYSILNLPAGEYTLQGRMIGLPSETLDSITVIEGQATWQDFILGYDIPMRYEWPLREDSPDTYTTLFLRIIGDIEIPIEGLFARTERRYCPVTQLSGFSFLVNVPGGRSTVTICLPYIGVKVFEDLEFSDDNPPVIILDASRKDLPVDSLTSANPLEIADFTEDEWLAPGFTINRTTIALTKWGNNELQNSGFIRKTIVLHSPYAQGSWRILLVYCDRVVVLADGVDPVEYPIEFPSVKIVYTSRDSRYVLAYDAIGKGYSSGDVILLDTVTGNSVRFDPSPERLDIPRDILPPEILICSMNQSIMFFNSGILGIMGVNSMKFFNENGELFFTRTYDHFTLRLWQWNHWLSADGSRIFALGYKEGKKYFFTFDNNFRILSEVYIPDSIWTTKFGTLRGSDTSLTKVLATDDGGSLFVLDTQSGQLMHRFSEVNILNSKLSRNGCYVGYISRENMMDDHNNLLGFNDNCFVWNLDTGSILHNFRGTEEWPMMNLCAVTDLGGIVLMLTERFNRSRINSRLAIIAGNGELLWMSSARRVYDFLGIADNGMRIAYTDGRFVNILSFTQE